MERIRIRFSARLLLILVAIAAAFFAGQRSMIREADRAKQRQRKLEGQVAKLMGFRLYPDEYAKEVEKRVEELTIKDGRIMGGPMEERQLFNALKVDKERLPRLPSPHGDEIRVFSPSYVLYLTLTYSPINIGPPDGVLRTPDNTSPVPPVQCVRLMKVERGSLWEHLQRQ